LFNENFDFECDSDFSVCFHDLKNGIEVYFNSK